METTLCKRLYEKIIFTLHISCVFSLKFSLLNVEPLKVQLIWVIRFL